MVEKSSFSCYNTPFRNLNNVHVQVYDLVIIKFYYAVVTM